MMNQEEMIRILIVDDEESIVEFLRMGLNAAGYSVFVAYDGVQAIALAKEVVPHLIILDLMLPRINGYDVCTQIKSILKTTIIMLTAKDEVDDCVRGLNLGADDYMVKPFSFKELLARIQVRIRNTYPELLQIIEIGRFKLDQGSHTISFCGNKLELSPTEYNLLKYLLLNQGLVLSKELILEKVWGYDFEGDENIVEVYVGYIRHKIGPSGHQVIRTVRGAGYKVESCEKA